MSLSTWTPIAVGSETRETELEIWRVVEAQHVIATRSLVDTLDEQLLLEQIIDEVKPPMPEEARELHYLLATPFRYLSPIGTRFRGPFDPGIFYGAEEIRTSCAELGYWRWRFLMESPQLPFIDWKLQFLFAVQVRTGMVDLRLPPFDRDRATWKANTYDATQEFARHCRAAGVGGIRYESARDPDAGGCAAILTPQAFTGPPDEPRGQHWHLLVRRDVVLWRRDSVFQAQEFKFDPDIWTG